MGEPLSIDTVLVPVDGSDESTGAVEYAIAVAAAYDAIVHVMYVFGERATRAIESGTADDDRVAAEGLSYIDAVEDLATGRDVPLTHSVAYGFSPDRLTVHPGSVVLEAADQMAADFVVIPRVWREEPSAVLEKAAEYVLLYASQPVLSV